MKFLAFDPFITQLRTDKGWRVTFEVPQSEYDTIKELPNLQERELVVTVEDERKKDKRQKG